MNACSRWRLYDRALAASWFYVKQLLILLNSKVPSFAAAWRTFLRKKTKRCPFHSSIFPKLKEPNSIFKCIKKFTWYKKGVFATIYYFWNIFLRISQHLIKPTPIRSHQRWCSGTSAPSMALLITLLFILHTAHKIITCFLREQQGKLQSYMHKQRNEFHWDQILNPEATSYWNSWAFSTGCDIVWPFGAVSCSGSSIQQERKERPDRRTSCWISWPGVDFQGMNGMTGSLLPLYNLNETDNHIHKTHTHTSFYNHKNFALTLYYFYNLSLTLTLNPNHYQYTPNPKPDLNSVQTSVLNLTSNPNKALNKANKSIQSPQCGIC